MVVNDSMEFPAVTVCNENALMASRINVCADNSDGKLVTMQQYVSDNSLPFINDTMSNDTTHRSNADQVRAFFMR